MRSRAAAAALLLPTWLLPAGLICGAPARAASEYVILGAGSRPCGAWLQVRSQPTAESAVLQSWVLGYVTSVNANVLTTSQDVADGSTPDALFAGIDKYCAAHPLDSLSRATGNLVESLRAKNKAR